MFVQVSSWRDWSCLAESGSGLLKERRRGRTGTCCSFGFEPFFNGGDLTGVSVSAVSSSTALAGRWFFLRLLVACLGTGLLFAFGAAFAAVGFWVLLDRFFISSISSGVALGFIICDKCWRQWWHIQHVLIPPHFLSKEPLTGIHNAECLKFECRNPRNRLSVIFSGSHFRSLGWNSLLGVSLPTRIQNNNFNYNMLGELFSSEKSRGQIAWRCSAVVLGLQ